MMGMILAAGICLAAGDFTGNANSEVVMLKDIINRMMKLCEPITAELEQKKGSDELLPVIAAVKQLKKISGYGTGAACMEEPCAIGLEAIEDTWTGNDASDATAETIKELANIFILYVNTQKKDYLARVLKGEEEFYQYVGAILNIDSLGEGGKQF